MPLLPEGSPVLVTGAGGFVGGHVARALAAHGYRVRAWARHRPPAEPGDPLVEWCGGDLRRVGDVARALRGMKSVVHTAGWVSLGRDPCGESRQANVEATATLLERSEREEVNRFVYTSTLWTVGSGTPDVPADETSSWNLSSIRCPYSETKREAERLVLERNRSNFRTSVICPGLVVGPRDLKPTSTGLFLAMAGTPWAVLPSGGIPTVDARVVALAHVRALERGRPGARYIVAGRYLSYAEMARIVAELTGRPRRVLGVPDRCQPFLRFLARQGQRLIGFLSGEVSEAAVAGGFLKLYVDGSRADSEFELHHPDPIVSIYDALDDHRRSGRAPWIQMRPRAHEVLAPLERRD
jgi:dihydroflavonol-4-reductase